MTSECVFYPLRGVIRCLAKSYLASASDARVHLIWDATLFYGLSTILLNPTLQPLLTSPYPSRDEAVLIEEHLARLLADTYQRILRQRYEEKIRQLNALL